MPTITAPVPRHIAIVMDGNGRWAKQRRQPRTFGHRKGQEAVRASVGFCQQRGVEALTLFAFSSENWKRPADEVGALMRLLLRALEREVDELHENGVQLNFIGALDPLSAELRERMDVASTRTAGNDRLRLNIALNYGGRWDIVQAARAFAADAARQQMAPEQLDEKLFESYLCLQDMPPVDLFIRTGGEQRISNFLLWQLAYAELYFTPVLWPDVDADVLDQALDEFGRRERRFGMTSAQLQTAPA